MSVLLIRKCAHHPKIYRFSERTPTGESAKNHSSNGTLDSASVAELGEPVGLPNNAPVILVLGIIAYFRKIFQNSVKVLLAHRRMILVDVLLRNMMVSLCSQWVKF
ncbi:hypothetical protein B9Z55_023450 [Caenorhabditis nigoni]|uniref:Uncharacterized protein n=1 Tax=Caenorhabditis nigoni TaxID=1611254 RepID=A0A2G5SQ02_9PELO|nr:hypothetical protein B9Z55_023450 [Caenorhabditis nigoni]